jgi:PadR family transcriptional regulator, regulatory protein PadR
MNDRNALVSTPRMYVTGPLVAVISAIIAANPNTITGAQICRSTKLKSGTVYPMLMRLEGKGWLSSEMEDIDPRVAKRPRRKYYRLTAQGGEEGGKMLRNLAQRMARALQLSL